MKTRYVLLALLAGTHTAAARGPGPDAPAWCKGLTSSGDILDRALTDDDPDRGIPAIVEFQCFPDADSKAKAAQLEARRQYWMKRMFMSEADWAADVPDWAGTSYSIRNTAHVDPKEDAVAWSSAGPVEQFALLSMHAGRSDAFSLSPGAKPYMADAFNLSQAGRIALIADCIHTNWDNEVKPVEWATCQPDIDALDGNKLATELRADSQRTPYDRMVVRAAWANLQPKLVEHAVKMKALLAKDEVYGKLIEIARATHKEWTPDFNKDLRALVLQMDDARVTGSKKALAGCTEKTWPTVAAMIGKLAAKDLATMTDPMSGIVGQLVRTPDGYLAANALAACEGNADPFIRRLGGGVHRSAGYRGPHTATATKLMIANLEPDRRGDKLSYGESGIDVAVGKATHAGSGSVMTVVSAVADEGDTLRVEAVKTHEVQEQCVLWEETGKPIRIDNNGYIQYETRCKRRETIDANTTPKPVNVAKRYSAGIVKGSAVLVEGGVAVMVISPKAKTPSYVLGVAVQ